jgi:hypothetical protein
MLPIVNREDCHFERCNDFMRNISLYRIYSTLKYIKMMTVEGIINE